MKYILFDLDGTLTDPQKGITNAVAYALRHFGIETEDNSSLNKFIGPPLIYSFVEFSGLREEQAKEAIKKYREYFAPKGIFENKVYDGVPNMLQRLRDRGDKVILATSKPWIYAEQILEHFDLKKYFDFVSGSEMNGDRNSKEEVIAYAVDKYGIDKDRAIMIGDRKHDIIGANKNNIKSIGVLYGYGNMEEFSTASAVAENVEDIIGVIDSI